MLNEKAIAAVTVNIIKEYTAPLLTRIAGLEKQLSDLPTPKDGADADEDAIVTRVTEKLAGQIAEIKAVIDDMPELPEIPEFPELPDIPAMVADAVKEAMPDAPEAPDLPDIAAMVAEAVKTIPEPKDGADGRDGLDVKDMFRAEGGHLLATMSDGTVKDLGRFIGNDGDAGADGVGFDDLSFEHDGERGVSFIFRKGEIEKRFDIKVPMVLDRGVFSDGKAYEHGDAVSYGGSLWISQKDAPEGKPGLSDDWRLSVKKGRNAKGTT